MQTVCPGLPGSYRPARSWRGGPTSGPPPHLARKESAGMFRQQRGKIVLSLVFGVLVMATLSIVADGQKLADTLRGFNWRLLPLVLGLTLFNYALRFLKWQFYLRLIGVRDLSTRNSFGIFFSAFT